MFQGNLRIILAGKMSLSPVVSRNFSAGLRNSSLGILWLRQTGQSQAASVGAAEGQGCSRACQWGQNVGGIYLLSVSPAVETLPGAELP